MEINRPKPIDWTPTLSKDDKSPYGAYILYNEIRQLFPNASMKSFREPAYNVIDDEDSNNAYIIISPQIDAGRADLDALLQFVANGNYVFASAFDLNKKLMDSLGLETESAFDINNKDSTSINFVNPVLKANKNYSFKRLTIDQYFSKLNKKDSTTILGVNQNNDPDFVKVQWGNGVFFIHAAPLCFSNYFMLFRNNAEYVSKALSYIPSTIDNIYWDEFYKSGRDEPQTPLRFLLSNEYLRCALRITIILMVVFVLFDMKRRQRIIPVIEPLRNTSLDFIKTVSSVYFNKHYNKGIAEKKFQYWFENIRQRYYLSTQNLDEEFIQQLQRKSGVAKELITGIINYFQQLQNENKLNDETLLKINKSIDSFYQLSQS
jgi:hypothetical protein